MGMLDKWFGGHKDYPSLAADSEAQSHLDEVKAQLETLADEIKDPMEVVPADHAAYVFIGKPPTRFGLAWIHDGKLSNFKNLVEEKHLSPPRMEKLVDDLRDAYTHAKDAQRYKSTVGDRDVTVIPSESLEKEVQEIIRDVT